MSPPAADRLAAVLAFWFGPDQPRPQIMRAAWFEKNPAFDEAIRQGFLGDHERAARGEYDAWAATPDGVLGLCILLDQFPRNMFRGEARAFATDAKILGIACRAVEAGLDREMPPVERCFLYLPFEHSESLADQERSVALFSGLPAEHPETARGIDYARRHLEIVRRFGRFPHRNAALGRPSTPEEAEFLTQPGSSF